MNVNHFLLAIRSPLSQSFGVIHMKPKTIYILVALLVNLGLMLWSSHSRVGASADQTSSGIFFPCCKKTDDPEGGRYCCENCCIFRWDCLADEDCAPRR